MGLPLNLRFDEYQYRFDYDGQTDGSPKYQGMAPQGVGEDDARWTIYLWEYDGSRQATKRTMAFKASWTNRATATYA